MAILERLHPRDIDFDLNSDGVAQVSFSDEVSLTVNRTPDSMIQSIHDMNAYISSLFESTGLLENPLENLNEIKLFYLARVNDMIRAGILTLERMSENRATNSRGEELYSLQDVVTGNVTLNGQVIGNFNGTHPNRYFFFDEYKSMGVREKPTIDWD